MSTIIRPGMQEMQDFSKTQMSEAGFEELKARLKGDFPHASAESSIRRATAELLEDPDPALMPIKRSFYNAYEQHQLEEMSKNFKLTPATLAFRLENKKVQEDEPLKWYPSPFLLFIALKIAIGIAKGNARIIVSAPPRHGKSRISTIHGPLWCLENFADKHIVTTTYGADLSEDFARLIRDFIYDNPDDLDVRIRQDASKIAKFLTNKNGALTSIGIGGPITGRGADVLLIDDFIKQIKEALSPTYRDYVYDWFTTTAMTRLEPNASVIIIATRWHRDDLIGRILKKFGTKEEGGDWDYIKLHAIARENDPLGREPGAALFPQRYSTKVLAERKKLLGTMYYDAIFDQEPHESDSDLTKKEWLIKIQPEQIPMRPLRLVRTWDFAGTETAKSDWTAGALQGADDSNEDVYLLNMIRRQITAAKVEALVKETAENDGRDVEIVICQETGSAGKAVIEYYQRTILKGFKVTGHYWNVSKSVIAQPWLACCESGHFFMLEAPWNEDFIEEFSNFPSEGAGYHDDQVDVCANGFIKLFGRKKRSVTWGRKNPNGIPLKAISPEEAAKIAERQAKSMENSPHRLLPQTKKWSFGVMKGATFGRRNKSTYN